MVPQNPSADLWTCFERALAPTVSLGGLGLSSSCSGVNSVNLLLKWSKTQLIGGGHTSFDPGVFLIPIHVRNPLGVRATRKALISSNKFWLSSPSLASKISSTDEVSFDRVSISRWVSSSSRPGHFLYLIGNEKFWFQRTSTTQNNFTRFPLG